ncbi:unnamed protein product, partial [Ixodes persulcatus]
EPLIGKEFGHLLSSVNSGGPLTPPTGVDVGPSNHVATTNALHTTLPVRHFCSYSPHARVGYAEDCRLLDLLSFYFHFQDEYDLLLCHWVL